MEGRGALDFFYLPQVGFPKIMQLLSCYVYFMINNSLLLCLFTYSGIQPNVTRNQRLGKIATELTSLFICKIHLPYD